MKNVFFIVILFIGIIGCNSQKSVADSGNTVAKNDTVRIANDSLEYEVIIIDAGFNSWLASRAYPRKYYSQTYFEGKNRFWVSEWNIRVNNPQRFGDLYGMRIDYDPSTNYGYEVNYLLYNYLVYFQNKYNQRLGGHVPDR